MTNDLIDAGLAALAFSRQALLGMFDSLPEDKLLHQPCPDANHAMWILGHLACADEYFMNKVADRPFNKMEAWKDKFFIRSKPTTSAADYPPIAEVKETLANNREALISCFGKMDEAKLRSPLPEDMQDFAPSHTALIPTIAWHEGMHTGQLSVIRKSLSLPPVFG